MDNNVVASENYRNIIAEIRDLGFTPGAKLARGRVPVQRRVDFNQGVDARILCKDPMYLREMSTICLKPLRIAFDHIGVRKPYEQAIRYAHEFGMNELSNYMLYNFKDSPEDLYLRMRLNIDLNDTLGTRIFSFPMRYQPTDMKSRTHVGPNWNRFYLRSMQVILQATHGIVSGSPDFFCRAFGNSVSEFQALLARPERFLFNRDWYERQDGRGEFDDYQARYNELAEDERGELLGLLSGAQPSTYGGLIGNATSTRVRAILPFYQPIPKQEEAEIWAEIKRRQLGAVSEVPVIPADELVEDAGLSEAIG
jgi:hypothetical protein